MKRATTIPQVRSIFEDADGSVDYRGLDGTFTEIPDKQPTYSVMGLDTVPSPDWFFSSYNLAWLGLVSQFSSEWELLVT